MFQIKMLYQYVEDFFAALSINAIENLNMSQKNSETFLTVQLSTIGFY